MSLDAVAEAGALVNLTGLLGPGEIDDFAFDYLSWGHFTPSVWRNYPHSHSYFEVCLVFTGAGIFTLGGQDHRVGAGSLFVARPGDVHEIVSSSDRPLGIAFWGLTLRPLHPGSEGAAGWWSGLMQPDRPVVSTSLGPVPALLVNLADEARRPRAGYPALLTALAGSLAVATSRAFACDDDLVVEPPTAAGVPATVALMERYLADNLDRRISVGDVAAQVHLSERHAARLFHRHTGVPLMAMLRRLRMDHAAQLILETSDSVTQIARSCGYIEVRPFITAFRNEYGQPPGSFRANLGTLHL